MFRNRKGYFSVNVQVISDAKNNIIDIVARWPGSAHDSNIFENSVVRMRFENGDMGDGVLLGDSGYPVRKYLITPLNNPVTQGETLFNEAQIRTRNVVERTFGIWKRRFPILSVGMRCSIPLAQNIIIATAVLHNIACRNNEPVPDEPVDLVNFEQINRDIHHFQNASVRLELINYFENLH